MDFLAVGRRIRPLGQLIFMKATVPWAKGIRNFFPRDLVLGCDSAGWYFPLSASVYLLCHQGCCSVCWCEKRMVQSTLLVGGGVCGGKTELGERPGAWVTFLRCLSITRIVCGGGVSSVMAEAVGLTRCSHSFRSGEASQVQLLRPELQAAQFSGGAQGTLPQLSAECQSGGCWAGHESPWWVQTASRAPLDWEQLVRVFFPISFSSFLLSLRLLTLREAGEEWMG